MRVGSGVILFQLAGFLTSALADFYFAKHTLTRWIKEYKANGYNIIKKKRGRHAHANQEETDIRRIGERECRASPEELAAYHRERICKKIALFKISADLSPECQILYSRNDIHHYHIGKR